MLRLLTVTLAFVACAAPPKGMRAETVGSPPLQCFQKCSGPAGPCELVCEPQLQAIRWVPNCNTQCARFDGQERANCLADCERPLPGCGNAPAAENGPVFKAVFVTIVVIGGAATSALALHQAIDR